MISYFMGNYLSCLDQAKAQLVVPVLFMIIMFFLPDSPEFWANKDEDKVKNAHIHKMNKKLTKLRFLSVRRSNHENFIKEALLELKATRAKRKNQKAPPMNRNRTKK